jgi:hypothetical protein
VGWQVAQHPELAVAERIEHERRAAGRRRGRAPAEQAENARDQRGMRGPLPAVPLQQFRGRVQQKRHDRAVGFG